MRKPAARGRAPGDERRIVGGAGGHAGHRLNTPGLREMHAPAFGWEPPDLAGLERLGATWMRQYVRVWIKEWDLDLVRTTPTRAAASAGRTPEVAGLPSGALSRDAT